MSIDLSVPQSRRALLGAVVGGLAATAANALGKPAAALATDGQPILQGVDNAGSASTVVRSNNSTALQGVTDATSGAHYGVRGRSSSTTGIGTVGIAPAATGSTTGVFGQATSLSGSGVRGEAPGRGVEGRSTAASGSGVAVLGTTTSPDGIGVLGEVEGAGVAATGVKGVASRYGMTGVATGNEGTGVWGFAGGGGDTIGVLGTVGSSTGIAVSANSISPAGTGLRVTGKAVFSRSGRATVPTGQSQVTVMNIPLTASSLVLATIQGVGAANLYVRAVSVSVSNSRFTIRLSQNVAANTLVGWFIAN